MSRFYVSSDSVKDSKIFVKGEEAHHILDVMRLGKLDKVTAFDGTGVEYVGFIKETARRSLIIEIVETRTPLDKQAAKITLIQAIPKKDKMDYIVEKSTELGVNSIIPVITKRTIPDWDESKKKAQADRWRRITKEASKQCGRTDVPDIRDITDFEGALKYSTDYDLSLIAALSDRSIKLREAFSGFKGGKLAVAIGPEGDFTKEEIDAAVAMGFKLINLGPRVLKSDTAGLAVLAILNYELTN